MANKEIAKGLSIKTLFENIKVLIKRNFLGDPYVWVFAAICSFTSIVAVYSSTVTLAFKNFGGNTEYFLLKQTILIVATWFCMWVAHKMNYRKLGVLSQVVLFVSVILLVCTQLFGLNINSATRWLQIPIINQRFQPSDFASYALIARVSYILSGKKINEAFSQQKLFSLLFTIGLVVFLIMLSNTSSAILLLFICSLMMILGGVPIKILGGIAVASILIVAVTISFGERGGTAKKRIVDFFDETSIPYQQEQAYIAIAGGGVTGRGAGQSQQKHLLPHPYSDYIFPIIVEEYGLLGGLFVITIFILLLFRCLRISQRTENIFGKLLTMGLGCSLVLQALVNMAVAVGLGPITGIPLPFISMGGTSLFFSGLSLGTILSVSRSQRRKKNRYG